MWVDNATPLPLYSRERPGTHCIGGWGGPQGRSGRVRKISPPPGFDPRTVQPVTSRYTDCTISALKMKYRSLYIGIKRMWNMKCYYSCDNYSHRHGTKVLNGNLEAIRGKHSLEPLQKTVVREISHITREVLQSET